MKVIEVIQSSAEWLEWRRHIIGASEAGAVLGLNPFCSPLQLWEQKTLGWERPMTDVMRQGQINEPEARAIYESIKYIKVEPLVAEWDSMPFIAASFDGIDIKTNTLVEIKCGKSSFMKAMQGVIPAYYECQMQQQMLVAGLSQMDYFCYDAESKHHVLMPVKRNDDLIKRIIDMNIHFWQHVCDFTPPEDTCCNWSSSLTREI